MSTELVSDQRTDAWLEARLGRATASRFADVLAKVGKGEAASRAKYRIELALERIKGEPVAERFTSGPMRWGIEVEDLARTRYFIETQNEVQECGFFAHDTLQAGASPDGLVGDEGQIEIKSPEPHTHLATLRTGDIPSKYIPQCQGAMWITGRKWCDFISFDPIFPPNARLFIKRVPRDEAYIANLASEVAKFLHEVEQEIAFVRSYRR